MKPTKTEELQAAKDRGYLLTRRPPSDDIFRKWGRWCDQNLIPDVYARVSKKYAHVRLDMAPSGKALTEQALQQAIVLLFGQEWLSIHRRLLQHRRDHGLRAAQMDRYFKLVGNALPVVLLHAKRIPAERAEVVAEQLVKLARGSLESEKNTH